VGAESSSDFKDPSFANVCNKIHTKEIDPLSTPRPPSLKPLNYYGEEQVTQILSSRDEGWDDPWDLWGGRIIENQDRWIISQGTMHCHIQNLISPHIFANICVKSPKLKKNPGMKHMLLAQFSTPQNLQLKINCSLIIPPRHAIHPLPRTPTPNKTDENWRKGCQHLTSFRILAERKVLPVQKWDWNMPEFTVSSSSNIWLIKGVN